MSILQQNINYRTDKLFSVQVNGAIVASDITREAAQAYIVNRKPRDSVYVYLTERPLEDKRRKRPRLTPPIPRLPSMRVSDAEREKLRAALLADGTLTEENEHGNT